MTKAEHNGRSTEGEEVERENEETMALTKNEKNIDDIMLTEKTTVDSGDVLHDGCIILGHDSEKGGRYCTRFHIDRAKQRNILSVKDVLIKACCPCFIPKRKSFASRIWQIFRSQAFLLGAHFLVVIFGVLKECMNLRTVAKEAHMMHSIAETFVTVLIITIRLVSAWHAFNQLKIQRHNIEYVDPKLGAKLRSRTMKKLMVAFTVVAVLLLIFSLLCFLLFYLFAHLGWTILSNSFALVSMMASDGLLRARMASESNLITADHRKAVTFEMSLLLNEATNAPDGPVRDLVYRRVKRFQKAFNDTELFNQPDYISISDEYKAQGDQLNMLTTMEVI